MSIDPTGDLIFGDFRIDRADERLVGPQGPVKLGNKAFQVLMLLAGQSGRLVTKDALFSSVWDGTIVTESALTSVIKELRRALGDESRTPRYIESAYGRGYRFIAPVESGDHGPFASAPGAPTTAEGQPPLVLVSAFRDDAVRARHPHSAAWLREEVVSALARLREIQLVSDNRPEQEAGTGRPDPSDRDYQLTATLLPDGEGVKVAARAKRLADGRVVWAETMSLADTGTAGGVEKIVRRIVAAALPALDGDLLLGLPAGTGDLYDRYLLAKHRSFTAATFAEAKAATEALEAIIAERPAFALAYPPLVRLYNIDFGYTAFGATGPAERARALALAKAGLAADRANVHAYTVLGFCYVWQKERDLARKSFEWALALNPYNHVRLQEVAAGLVYTGDAATARALMERASELNPIPDDNFFEDSGRLRLFDGDYEGALAMLESIMSGTIWAEFYRAICEIRLGSEQGSSRIAAWRARVGAGWHGAARPSPDDIKSWIARHHPLPGAAGERFFADVEEALGRPVPARPALRVPG